MSKKKLNTTAIASELEGAVSAFAKSPAPASTPAPLDSLTGAHSPTSKRKKSLQLSYRASSTASTIASNSDEFIDRIRKTVKSAGEKVSFVRLTTEEKNLLVDIVYTYKRQGVKTSENEINRIAVNFLMEDYKAYGQESVLARVIAALLA